MSLFSIKSIFEREKEIMRLRRVNRDIHREWLNEPDVMGEVGSDKIIVHDPVTDKSYIYERVRQ